MAPLNYKYRLNAGRYIAILTLALIVIYPLYCQQVLNNHQTGTCSHSFELLWLK